MSKKTLDPDMPEPDEQSIARLEYTPPNLEEYGELHELTHGMAMQIFGAKPKFGILWKGLMFYATSPEYAYHRNNYVVIALAPLIFISILAVLGIWLLQGTLWIALLGICGTLNASGAVGDMWITMIVLRYANTAYVIDERDGIRLFLPKS